jgi:VAD1 Analog of StAR-related lipid transfer domain
MKTIERESELSHQLSRAIEGIKASKLDNFLSTSEKQIKEASEQDDALWKHLCDAARTAMRADAKYKQNTAQTAKARERVRSVDMDKGSDNKPAKSQQKVNRAMDGMNKAFGNFLSILPDGGEQAMQILTPDARRAVAERAAKEADEKEMKGRQALENAVACKIRAMATYKSKAEALTEQYELEEISGVEDIKVATESLVACLKTMQTSRYEALGRSSEAVPLEAVLVDLEDWVDSTVKRNKANVEQTRQSDDVSPTTGFMLRLVLAESDNALKFACIEKTEPFDSEYSEKENVADNSNSGLLVDTSPSMDRSVEETDALKNEDEASRDNGQQSNRWLQKSLSTPIGKHGFKPFRKYHSMGDDELENGEIDATDDATETLMVPAQNSKEMLDRDVFLAFWPDYEGTPPVVAHTFSCAFLPRDCTKKTVSSVEHGRLFLTHAGAVFIAWRGKKAVVQYSSMTAVEKCPSVFIPSANDTLLITTQGSAAMSTLLLGCFSRRDETLQIIQGRIDEAANARAEVEAAKKDIPGDGKYNQDSLSVAPVAPDLTLPKMETVLSKKIRGIPVNTFHDIVWSDKAGEEPLYGRWLGSGGKCFDIRVGAWETSAVGFTGAWCGETYSHKRKVSFQLKRNSRIGPPVAGITQTQFCRLDDNKRSVMQMTVAFSGIPYADTFQVEVRWIATRSGKKDVAVQVAVYVEFLKSTLLKSQIRSGALSETKPVHENLFAFVNTALSKAVVTEERDLNDEDENDDEGDKLQEPEKASPTITSTIAEVFMENWHVAVPAVAAIAIFFLWWPSSSRSEIASLHSKIEDMQTEMRLMRHAIEQLTLAMKE